MLSVVNDYAGIVAELHILVIAFSGYVSCNDISRIQHRLNFHLILCDDVDRIDIITIQAILYISGVSDSECLTHGGESKRCIGICVFCNFVFCIL